MTSYGILNTYFLSQYSARSINYDSLFCHILLERLKLALLVFLFGKVVEGRWFLIIMECIVAFLFGFLMVAAIANLGVRGIAITAAGLLPQYIFYLLALFLYAAYLKSERYPVWHGGMAAQPLSSDIVIFVLLCILIFAGIVTESYINPIFLKKVLKIF